MENKVEENQIPEVLDDIVSKYVKGNNWRRYIRRDDRILNSDNLFATEYAAGKDHFFVLKEIANENNRNATGMMQCQYYYKNTGSPKSKKIPINVELLYEGKYIVVEPGDSMKINVLTGNSDEVQKVNTNHTVYCYIIKFK